MFKTKVVEKNKIHTFCSKKKIVPFIT